MFSIKRILALVAISLMVVSGVACGDDTTSSESNEGRPDNTTDTPGDDGELRHLGDSCDSDESTCTLTLTTGTEQDLEVELVDGDDTPVHDAQIDFEVDNEGDAEVGVGSSSTYTDAGEASTTVTSGENVGNASITASVADDEDVDPIEWEVVVSSKDAGPYEVTFAHDGEAELGDLDVRLYEPDTSCSDLESGSPPTAAHERSDAVSSSGDFPPVTFPDIQNGESFTVAAHAYSYENGEVEAAYGCEDDTDEVDSGSAVEVEVELIDHLPQVAGEYAVTHHFDLRDALPDRVRGVVNLIGRLATDPGSFVLGCPDDGGEECPDDATSLVGILVDFLPDGDLKDSIEDFVDSDIANAVARDAINQVAEDWLSQVPGYDEAGDVYDTMRQFRVDGTMRIDDEPDVSVDEENGEVVGELADGAGYQQWEEIVVYWTGNCSEDDAEDCPERSFGTRDLDQDTTAVEGEFGGTVTGDGLEIDAHTLSLNYGALLTAIVENVILPEVFGDNCGDSENEACDSFEDSLRTMLDCGDVASLVADEEGGSTYDVVEDMCDNLVDQAGNQLRDYAAEELVAEGDDVFQIGSGSTCQLHQPDSYEESWETSPYPYAETLGTEEEICEWDVSIQFSGDDPTEVGGEFWGEREEF